MELTRECEKYKEEVADLRRQVKIMVSQYDDAIVRFSNLNEEYKKAKEEIASLQDQLKRWQKSMEEAELKYNRILIAAVGMPESSSNMDLASLRAVKMETGMAFEAINEATPQKLQNALDQARGIQAVTYLHLSIRSDEDGYQLMDEIVDANWLSSNLQGVVVLLVAGSDSSAIGEFIGVVPYVITMNDKIPSKDAARFTRHFWTEIGRGIGPNLALNRALAKAPGRMSEYVKRHWVS